MVSRKVLVLVLCAGIPACWQPLWGRSPSVVIQPSHDQQQQTKLGANKAGTDQRGTKDTPLIVETHSRTKSDQEAAEDKRAEDRKHRIDCWTFRLTVANTMFTGLLMLVGIGGIVLAIRSLRALQAQAEASKTSMEVLIKSERAWLSITISVPDQIESDKGALFWLYPTIKNNGRTVARITRILLRVQQIPTHLGTPGKLPEQPDFSSQDAVISDTVTILPPGDSIQPINVPIRFQSFMGANVESWLYVYGVVYYLDTLGEDTHYTRFCCQYSFYRPPDGFDRRPPGFVVVSDAPPAYLGAT